MGIWRWSQFYFIEFLGMASSSLFTEQPLGEIGYLKINSTYDHNQKKKDATVFVYFRGFESLEMQERLGGL